MRITRLQLRDLGRHRVLDVALAPGFTIIRGPNEAGKTTIQRALELALFRKATAASAEIETLRSWGAGEDERSSTRIEFVVDEEHEEGGVESRSGVLEKEFRGSHGRVSLDYDGHSYTDPARADEVIAELTGIPNEAFFRSTASIRHQELDDLDRDEGALRDRLQASIGGGDRGSSRAKTRLEDAIRALRSRGDKNPGRLKIAEEAVARAEQALKSGEAMLEKLEKDRDALAQARDARLRAEKEVAESRNLLELARQAERLRTDRAVVAERYERLRQAADAQKRLQELEAMPERPMSALRDQLDRMRTLQSRVSVLQDTLHTETAPEVEPDDPEPAYLSTGILTAVCLGLGLALVALGGVRTFLPVIVVGAIGLALGAYFATRFWERRAVALNVRRLNQSRERDRTIRRQTRVGTEEGLRVATSGVQNILRELGVTDIAAAEKLLTGEQSRRQEIATLQVQVAALLAGQSAGAVEELRDRAAIEIEQKTSALDSLGPLATDARSRERLEAEVRDRHAALERTRDAEAGAAARVDANPVDAEQVAGEAERLISWREQLAALQRRVRVYEKTLAIIQTSESGTMRKATRFLEQQVGRDIARLTGGRYRRVAIDDQTLDISVWAAERGDWVPATRLSKGTVDQIFLAARMGLVRLVTQGRRPPLILDDPFVTFDDARASRAALLLRELSSDFQVIYLACSNRYDGLADAVIALPGPTDTEAAALARVAATTTPAAPEPCADGGEPVAVPEAAAEVVAMALDTVAGTTEPGALPAETATAAETPPADEAPEAAETSAAEAPAAEAPAAEAPAAAEATRVAEGASPEVDQSVDARPEVQTQAPVEVQVPAASLPSVEAEVPVEADDPVATAVSPAIDQAPPETVDDLEAGDDIDEDGERLVVIADPDEIESAGGDQDDEDHDDGNGWHESETLPGQTAATPPPHEESQGS